MRKNIIRKAVTVTLGALMLTGSLAASTPPRATSDPASVASDWNFHEEASGLLKEVRALAYSLDRNADTLASVSRNAQLSWQTHASYLNQVKQDINKMGEHLDRLQTVKHVTAPWQQQAITRMVPVAVELASRTNAAIAHLNENRSNLFANVEYRDHLTTIAERSDDIKKSAAKFVDLGETMQRLNQIQEEL